MFTRHQQLTIASAYVANPPARTLLPANNSPPLYHTCSTQYGRVFNTTGMASGGRLRGLFERSTRINQSHNHMRSSGTAAFMRGSGTAALTWALVVVALLATAHSANEFRVLTGSCDTNGTCIRSPGYPSSFTGGKDAAGGPLVQLQVYKPGGAVTWGVNVSCTFAWTRTWVYCSTRSYGGTSPTRTH